MKRLAEAQIPTPYGELRMIAYGEKNDDAQPNLALVKLDAGKSEGVLIRIHSECMTGDIFHSLKCDCGEQLDAALNRISEEGGIVIYLRQEGRGIGLVEKLNAYKLQEGGADTVEANVKLGYHPDSRTYEDAVFILNDLGIKSVRLMTNNPDKIEAIKESDIELINREPIIINPNEKNKGYLNVKKTKMNQLL